MYLNINDGGVNFVKKKTRQNADVFLENVGRHETRIVTFYCWKSFVFSQDGWPRTTRSEQIFVMVLSRSSYRRQTLGFILVYRVNEYVARTIRRRNRQRVKLGNVPFGRRQTRQIFPRRTTTRIPFTGRRRPYGKRADIVRVDITSNVPRLSFDTRHPVADNYYRNARLHSNNTIYTRVARGDRKRLCRHVYD